MTEKAYTIFDYIVSECMYESLGYRLLEPDSSVNRRTMSQVPPRFRLIAQAFVEGLSTAELNRMLKKAGFAKLYARNFWESGLIYALEHHLSYMEWRALMDQCLMSRETTDTDADLFFNGNRLTCHTLADYLTEQSEKEVDRLITMHLTEKMEYEIANKITGNREFVEFLNANQWAFSSVREKTRYYFCKYLYYFLLSRIQRYCSAMSGQGFRTEEQREEAMEPLSVFRGVTTLKRRKLSPEESRSFLLQASISCGGIFDAFNEFYFGYISLDWMEILLEYYGNIENLSEDRKKRLAMAIRHHDRNHQMLSDDEILIRKQEELLQQELQMDAVYSRNPSSRGYQRNRSGENSIRKYLKGELDIDRTTLICFLIFFDHESDLTPTMRIRPDRLNEILEECGFSVLRRDHLFDDFIVRFLESRDPVDLLMNEVTSYALKEENFYLYRMFQNSRSDSRDMERLLRYQE